MQELIAIPRSDGDNNVFRASLILTLLLVLSPGFGFARTWYVLPDSTGDAPTIQAAIDSSGDGDTVLVAAGTYYVNLSILLKDNLSLIGESGREVTFLDARYPPDGLGNRRQVLRILSSDNVLVQGFTIQEGRPEGLWADRGGGFLISGGRCTIRDNIIRDNENVYGAAICFGASTAGTGGTVIENNVFQNNLSDGGCAGFYIYNIEGPIWIRENVFEGNAGKYAGVYSEFTHLYVQSNLFVGNVAEKYCVKNQFGNYLAEGNILYNNNASGIVSQEGTIRRNTCANNSGWGLSVSYGNLYNNISSGNGLDGLGSYNAGNVGCNNSWGNQGLNFIFEGTVGDTTGNISADPLFCAPSANDYSIASESPCAPEHSGGCGLIGALDVGCVFTAVPQGNREETSWGAIKKMFR